MQNLLNRAPQGALSGAPREPLVEPLGRGGKRRGYAVISLSYYWPNPYCYTKIHYRKPMLLQGLRQAHAQSFLEEQGWLIIGSFKVTIGLPINRIMHFYDPPKVLKTINLIKIKSLWARKSVRGYGRKVHAKFWPWGTTYDPIYDHFWNFVQSSQPQY